MHIYFTLYLTAAPSGNYFICFNKEPPSSVSTGDQTFMLHCEGVRIFVCLLAFGVFCR